MCTLYRTGTPPCSRAARVSTRTLLHAFARSLCSFSDRLLGRSCTRKMKTRARSACVCSAGTAPHLEHVESTPEVNKLIVLVVHIASSTTITYQTITWQGSRGRDLVGRLT